jgi:penicillin-insensitive murein endopeptidase
MKRKLLGILSIILIVCGCAIYFGNDVLIRLQSAVPSQSIGTVAQGSLINGKRLPTQGKNFRAYSRIGALLGRNTVHSKIREVILDAYKNLEGELPNIIFVYGETGWPHGGKFWPHKTHHNGLSVDFFVPVKSRKDGQPRIFPCSVFNKFGYSIEFDSTGKTEDLEIDFDAMAKYLLSLVQVGKSHGVTISKVIFDPPLQKYLFAIESGKALKGKVAFSTKPSWVRHDEHYHIDFKIDKSP